MTTPLKMNLQPTFHGAYTPDDRLFVWPRLGFAVTDGPTADAAAETFTPKWINVREVLAFQEGYAPGVKRGHIYEHNGAYWFCLTNNASTPARGSPHWLELGAGGAYRGQWAEDTPYFVGDVVRGEVDQVTTFFRCLSQHTSNGTTENLENATNAMRWERDSVPDYINFEFDSVGINSATSATLHLYSPAGHRHGDHVLTLERESVGDVNEITFISGGSEGGAIIGTDSLLRLSSSNDMQFDAGFPTTHRLVWSGGNSLHATGNPDLGTSGNRWGTMYAANVRADAMSAARHFADAAARDTALAAPLDGQLAFVGDGLTVYVEGQGWQPASAPSSYLRLTDTPDTYGPVGYVPVVDSTGAAMTWRLLAPYGWVRDPSRDVTLPATFATEATGLGLTTITDGLAAVVEERDTTTNSLSHVVMTINLDDDNRPEAPVVNQNLNATNGDPSGITASGASFFVADRTDNRLYTYAVGGGSSTGHVVVNSTTRQNHDISGVGFDSEANRLVVGLLGTTAPDLILIDPSSTSDQTAVTLTWTSRTRRGVAGVHVRNGRYWITTELGEVVAFSIATGVEDPTLVLEHDLPSGVESAGSAGTDRLQWLVAGDQLIAYRWAGEFFDSVVVGTGGTPPATGTGLPDWVVLNAAEESVGAEVFRANRIRNRLPDRVDEQQFTSRTGIAPDLTVGDEFHSVRIDGVILGDIRPAGVGLYDMGTERHNAWRTTYTENLRVRTIAPRVATFPGSEAVTGLHIGPADSVTGNLAAVQSFANSATRQTNLAAPIEGQFSYDEDTGLLSFWNGAAWLVVGGSHVDADADLSAVSQHILPALDTAYNLGAAALRWAHVWTSTVATNLVQPDRNQTNAPLRIGRGSNSEVQLRGRTTFDQATVVGAPTNLELFNETSGTTRGVWMYLKDDEGTTVNTTRITPEMFRDGIQSLGGDPPGSILRVNAVGQAVWVRDLVGGLGIAVINNPGEHDDGDIQFDILAEDGGNLASARITPDQLRDALAHSDPIADFGNGIRVGEGSAAEPSVSVVGDTDTGMYFSGNDTILWATGGVERMRLAVQGPEGEPSLILAHHLRVASGTASDVSVGREEGDSNTGMFFFSDSGNKIGFATQGVERWRITNNALIPNPTGEGGINSRYDIGAYSPDGSRLGNVITYNVNYQILSQHCSRSLKFAIGDAADATTIDKLNGLRVRRFKYKDNPGVWLYGLVADEIRNQSNILTGVGERRSIETNSLVAQLLYWVQRLQDGQDALFTHTGASLPAARTYTRDNDAAARGTPPPGWNADGSPDLD